MKTVESEMKNLFASGSVYTRRCPLASVVCLEFPFLNRLSPVGVPKTTAGKILFFQMIQCEGGGEGRDKDNSVWKLLA